MDLSVCEVLHPGVQTTGEDLGRTKWRHLGVARSGAMDMHAMGVANALVGNPVHAAGLEIALSGPSLELHGSCQIALTGAPIRATWNDVPLPMGRPLTLPAGKLQLRAVERGARSWLAVRGGIQVPSLMGSASTDLRGGFGGCEGRAVKQGDRFKVRSVAVEGGPVLPKWWVETYGLYGCPENVLRYLPAADPSALALARHKWLIHASSNRQGLRMQGQHLPVELTERQSEPVCEGTVQLPPDGQPILLLADAQTIGGYARLGYVLACDLGRASQLRLGDSVRFEPVDRMQAHALMVQSRRDLARTLLSIRQARVSMA
mgnify:CR=1 FL=1